MASIFSGRVGGKVSANNELGVNNDVNYQGDCLHTKEGLETGCSHRQGKPFLCDQISRPSSRFFIVADAFRQHLSNLPRDTD